MNELKVTGPPGLTATIQLYTGSTPFGSPISLTEVVGAGFYVGDMPGGVPYGQYMCVAFGGVGVVIGSNEICWDGQKEIPWSMMAIGGFDPANPAVNTPNSRVSGDINLKVDGYGTNNTTVTRQ